MTKEQIFAAIKKNVLDILPELDEKLITIDKSLRNLGANSIDRADIVAQSLEDLEIEIPLVELAEVKNLQGLVDVLHEKS